MTKYRLYALKSKNGKIKLSSKNDKMSDVTVNS